VDVILHFINEQYFEEKQDEYVEETLALVNEHVDFARNNAMNEIEKVISIELAAAFFDRYIQEIIQNSKDISIRELLAYITVISIVMYTLLPEYFFPYFFLDHFFKLEAIFNEFGIPLPPIPSKVKHEERLYYYFELCKALYEFRKNIGLSPVELNVFLYYFSKHIVDDFDIREEELPSPTKVYISGATKEDCTGIIAQANPATKSLWAGNVNTLPGDIIIIYGCTPFSQINSIWRAISKGFLDPFSYWFNLIWVGHPVKIPGIGYQELVEDKIWSAKPIVKSHMQGVSGVQCTVEEYNAIIKLAKKKGFDVKTLPKITGPQLLIKHELNNERDIEMYLLEPLLNKLGFTEKDWVRQMPVRMGRGERIYPDYAIRANQKRGEETAEFIWEAKYRITNQKQLKEAFFQAKSYALRLSAKGMALAAMEGIWLSYQDDNFYFDKILNYSWEELNKPDIFSKILLEINKR
jgi:hypothetical protein